MKKTIHTLLFFLLSWIFWSCGKSHTSTPEFENVVYSPQYSSSFSILSSPDSLCSLITVTNPWQGAKDTYQQLLILHDSLVAHPTSAQVLKAPAERIVCMSSTHIAMLDALGEADKIKGVSGIRYISNPHILSRSEFIEDIGYEGNVDYEKLVALQPDIVLLYSVNGASSMEPKLKELGIPYFYVGDYLEASPLGKAEWLIPLAEIIGKREIGIKKFNEIKDKYEFIRNSVPSDSIQRPKVMVGAPFVDSWFMPSSESYLARLIEDAGGIYIYQKNTGTQALPIDKEEAMLLVAQSDFWINTGTAESLTDLEALVPDFMNLKCVREGKVFNNNKLSTSYGGNDAYESGIVNPDLLLRDLIKIFNPELIKEDFVYYHELK
ncbi:MAG: ABC transporter substrate-binding protein [Muribaculaceae bacterium]|nr:ABC transporter substrate-binding protein [Muribaculaceae bacterium]